MKLSDRVRKTVVLDRPALPPARQLDAAIQRVLNRWPDVVAEPPEKDRERLVQDMLARLREDRWEDARLSMIASAAQATFDQERRERADLARLRQFYLDEVRASSRPTFLNAMVSVYVASYVPGSTHSRALGGALVAARDRIGARWQALLAALPELFDADRTHMAIADRMTAMADPWTELKAIGLRSPHAPGLMDHAHLAYIERLAPRLDRRNTLDWLLGWLKPSEQSSARASGASEAISAVLAPWRQREPREDHRSHITHSLVGLYGDPRTNPGSAWAGVPADLQAIIIRWLTGENIRFFLDVVTEDDKSHMWEPRRRFWLAMFEQGKIDGAWVAFTETARRRADRMLARQGRDGALEFGEQTHGGQRADTCLLILSIGSKVVVEGSHSYRLHVFDPKDKTAPVLYKKKYDAQLISKARSSDSKSHNCYCSSKGNGVSCDMRHLPGLAPGSRKPCVWQDWILEQTAT